jgi:hypothetical protein
MLRMTRRHKVVTGIAFATASLLSGCFGNTPIGAPSLGSTSKVVDTVDARTITRAYLLPIVAVTESGDNLGVDDTATATLWRDIEASNLFPLVPMDTVEIYIRAIGKPDSAMAFKLADSMGTNSFLIADLRYSKADMGLTNVADVKLQLVGVRTHKVIAYALYNTYISKSYFFPPSFETVRTDAIDGAAYALANAIAAADHK